MPDDRDRDWLNKLSYSLTMAYYEEAKEEVDLYVAEME